MTNELISRKSYWTRNLGWLSALSVAFMVAILLIVSSGMPATVKDLSQAYADTQLYDKALEKVRENESATKILGVISPLGKLAILEGETRYSANNNSVRTTVNIVGPKAKAKMDISAEFINQTWRYKLIRIRIKTPPELKQTIIVLDSDSL